jgi:hypothetical protein
MKQLMLAVALVGQFSYSLLSYSNYAAAVDH